MSVLVTFGCGPLPVLVGNNRVYREWGVLVSYYLLGNSLAPPPSHRAGGATAQVGGGACNFRVCDFPSHLGGGWEVEHPHSPVL